jgi:hypothetical protein
MRIYIPTRSRPYQQLTYDFFKEVADITFVCRREDLPPDYSGDWIETTDEKIRAKRQLILDRASESKFAIMDDDLRFFRKLSIGGLTNMFATSTLISRLNEVSNRYALTGIHPRFMINTAPPLMKEFSKIFHVMVINRDKLPQPKPSFRLETGEDHDFHLQVITRGGKTAVLTDYAQDDKEGAPGGCSDWREDVLQDVEELRALWPEFVRVKPNGRPVIYFKKASKNVQTGSTVLRSDRAD